MNELAQIDEGLDNWANYYRDTISKRVTFSLEGRYRPERKDVDYEEEAPPAARKPINLALAESYEQAITLLPYTEKMCLVVDYVYKWALQDNKFNRTCRICRVSPREWDNTVRKAKLMLINRIGNH